jgi:fatty-acyl-CoA synthase
MKMGLITAVKREYEFVTGMLRILGGIKKVGAGSGVRVPDHIEKTVDKFPDRPVAITDEGDVSYAAFDAYANRVAHWALEQGLKPGDTVSLFMPNRWEYIAIWFGLSKVGIITSLVNTQLAGNSLAHCLEISGSDHVIVEGELAEAYSSACDAGTAETQAWVVDGELAGSRDFTSALNRQSSERPDKSLRADVVPGDPVLKMFTSGTTGLPKAALMSHVRALYYLNCFATGSKSTEKDRMMLVLPLYHATGGLCGTGCALSFGGAMIIKRRFSASAFWPDAVKHAATQFMYVGELCRFLVNSEPCADEKKHVLRCAIGNGMRRDVWDQFQARFNLPDIIEFYGSTEGNVGLVNAMNQPGAIGRVPSYLKHRFNIELVRYDMTTDRTVRDENGYCLACGIDEPGEAIGRIDETDARFRFDGYGSEEDTNKKILRNVFKDGDAWFRTGDLLSRDKLGYFYFVDRVGDTYRWKSENVSTGEVAEALNFDGVEQANVYGVEIEGHSGRAGMAALVADQQMIDLDALREHIHESLPAFARPLFLRLQEAADTTGTFKFKKVDLVKDGFDPQRIKDAIYFDHPAIGKYVRLTQEMYEQIINGKVRV